MFLHHLHQNHHRYQTGSSEFDIEILRVSSFFFPFCFLAVCLEGSVCSNQAAKLAENLKPAKTAVPQIATRG